MEPVTTRLWVPRHDSIDFSTLNEYTGQLDIPPLLARLLIARDYSVEAAAQFLKSKLADLPDPALLPDIEAAVERLVVAIGKSEKIAVHGDYDVDGITGTVLLYEVLNAFGGEVEYHIPLRLRDGYGLSSEAIRKAAENGARVIVSVDCGVSAFAEAELAKSLGIDLIVTDHHQPAAKMPEALAVINPQREDSTFPFADLSGVGVAFFLMVALRKRLRENDWFNNQPEPDLRQYLDLVALGTIADLVPLYGVNRILTRHGLQLIQSDHRVSLKALKQVAGARSVNSGVVGYQLAPRLNAAGRMEDAGLGVELLLEKDMVCALNAARYLDQCNRERQELEKKTLREAESAVDRLPGEFTHSIVLACDGWHPGVIGIVASRLVERYNRPTVLIALDGENGKGSARSIRGYHLYRGLQDCAKHLTSFGGHETAAGLSLEAQQVDPFARALEKSARTTLSNEDLLPKLNYDGEVLLEEISLDVLRELEEMAPFGMGNPEPVLLVEAVRAMRIQELQGGHLRFTACQGAFSHPAIAFGMQQRKAEFDGKVDLLVSPQINCYQGRQTVQLRVRDIRKAETVESKKLFL